MAVTVGTLSGGGPPAGTTDLARRTGNKVGVPVLGWIVYMMGVEGVWLRVVVLRGDGVAMPSGLRQE